MFVVEFTNRCNVAIVAKDTNIDRLKLLEVKCGIIEHDRNGVPLRILFKLR